MKARSSTVGGDLDVAPVPEACSWSAWTSCFRACTSSIVGAGGGSADSFALGSAERTSAAACASLGSFGSKDEDADKSLPQNRGAGSANSSSRYQPVSL